MQTNDKVITFDSNSGNELFELPPEDKVALYLHRLSTGGGAQRMVSVLANALCEQGFAVHIITWDSPDAQAYYPLDKRVAWNRLDIRPGAADKLRRTRVFTRMLRDNGIRVLVGFVMTNDKTVFTAAKLARVRLIAAERNAPTMYYLFYGRVHRWLSFGLLHLADRITVQIPEFVFGYPASLRDRIEVIPNPVTKAACQVQSHQPNCRGRFVLLAVGRMQPMQKRHDCLVRAFARIAGDHPAWDLRIIGDGPSKNTLYRIAEESGVAARVRLEAWTSNIFTAYAQSHLFAMPSQWEGFPNALAEAMSHGLPAIGFRNAAGVAQLVAHGETGWLADGLDDDAALARALSAAMSDDTERARRGALAAESMAAYAPDTQFKRWECLLRSAIAERTDRLFP